MGASESTPTVPEVNHGRSPGLTPAKPGFVKNSSGLDSYTDSERRMLPNSSECRSSVRLTRLLVLHVYLGTHAD